MEPKKRLLYKRLLTVLIILTLLFIFGNSLKSREESSRLSNAVLEAIEPLVDLFGGGTGDDRLLRKVMHFAEFAALGGELLLLDVLRKRPMSKASLFSALKCFAAAGLDELIQVFSHRNAKFADVLLDELGAIFGIAAAILLCRIIRARRGSKK